jgi:MFS family permease
MRSLARRLGVRTARLLGAVALDVKPLRHREYRLFFIAFSTSILTSGGLLAVAIPYQIYVLTHSTLAVGTIGLVELAVLLTFAFLGGTLADAVDRRRMVLLTKAAMLGAAVLLAVNAALPTPQLWLVFALVAVLAAMDALQRPSMNALVPRLVDREEIPATSALTTFSMNVSLIAAPALAGLLIATSGITSIYVIAVAVYAMGLLALSLMRAVPPPDDAERPSLRRVVEGLQYARSRPELIGTYAVDIIAMLFGMPIALFPAFADRLGGGPSVLGLLYAAPAVGSLLMSLVSGWSRRIHRHGMAVILAAMGWGLAITAFGLAPNVPLALVFLALAGGGDALSGIFRSTIWNQTIPDSLRGRLASIELLSFSIGPTLGNFEAGAVAAAFGVEVSIVSGGVLCVAGCGVLGAVLKDFREYDDRTYRTAAQQPAADGPTPNADPRSDPATE